MLFAPLLTLLAFPAAAQTNPPSLPQKILLPGGPKIERTEDKIRREENLRADHEQNLKDAARIQELARELERDLKEYTYATMPASSRKTSEEIERLAKRIKQRLRR